ncbi:unnamed protein product [Adineta ricciae]|uniref:Uncharacterized protein n=1 Tax=Adineta ricciae TaxID=249248 RepID=A0A813UUY9_ADIRI|nr:unnamed protein product [Adineta ricciae]
MFYENLIPYYSPYEEQVLLRQMHSIGQQEHQHSRQENSFYYHNRRKEFASSTSLINSSLLNHTPLSSSSPSFFPPSPSNSPPSKKMTNSDLDALSFCHTIYITIKKNRNSLSCSSSSSSLNTYPQQVSGDSQLLLLPDICCTIPASKLSF